MKTTLDRRTLLRGSGAALALPLLDAMTPAFARSGTRPPVPRRMVAIQTNMGILPQYFFPEKAGRDYALTPYLEILKEFRDDFTVFSGVSHPHVDGGHQAEVSFLTGAPHPGSGSFKNTISLDQLAAEQMGILTRFPSLTILVCTEHRQSLSFTRSGALIPGERSPAQLFKQLFIQGTPEEIERRVEELRMGRSMLDSVSERARGLKGELGPRDRSRLDEYFTSVRELEEQLKASEAWERKPKPKVTGAQPKDIADSKDLTGRIRAMLEVTRLAIETDSTRLVSIFINPAMIVPTLPGVTHETHALTHHGNRPEALEELRRIEEVQLRLLAEFLGGLRRVREGAAPLLDRTMVLYGSCMGSANAHSNNNLPVLLAGGGFKHGQHLAFDRDRNYPLPNLFVSMLQRLGVETDKFASSSGTMLGLEMEG